MKKKWLKQKGCKNCALVWYEEPCYEECEPDCKGHGHWNIEPYHKGKTFVYLSKLEPITREHFNMVNIYYDEKTKSFVVN